MHYKTLFVSDIHLGTRQCQVQYLLNFLHQHTFDTIILGGDIVDIYGFTAWTKEHNTFIQKILRFSRKGVKVIYIPGNHDEHVRDLTKGLQPFLLGDIEIVDQYVYTSVKGYRLLVIHGDEFDGAIRSMGWLYWIGDHAYSIALRVNTIYNWLRKLFGLKYWSLSAYLKSKVKQAIQVVGNFEELVTRKCLSEGYDGIIYGHTHSPSLKKIKSKLILNDGDCVESVTCIVETQDGNFQLIKMTDESIIASI